MQRNGVPHPGKTLALFAGLAALMLLAHLGRSAEAVPFGAHAFTYVAGTIKPNSVTQAQLDTATSTFYTNWKAAYWAPGCAAGQGRINYDGGMQTVSEAHGYGMLIFVLMAGYDSTAHANFDAMYQYYKAHPATGANRLLAWQQDNTCTDINGPDTASDGDEDVALSLLMADRQWGSCGSIDYKAEGIAMINQLKAQDVNSTTQYVLLGNWATTGTYLNSTRSSDFMPGHYRSYQWATGDTAWTTLINHTYYMVTATANTTTGLLPDFIVNPLTAPAPAPPNFLEAPEDPDYNWNACRDPWRLATDYLCNGDARSYAEIQKLVTWAKGAPISGNANNVRAGYQLNGTQLVSYGDRAFTLPFAVAGMVDASNQAYLNSFWGNAQVSGTGTVDYFGDSIKMLCMIVLSGNWWAPEAMPDPCAVGTPTATKTATPLAASTTPSPSRTATRTATASATLTMTPTVTVPAATASATPSSTATRTGTASATLTVTPTSTVPAATASSTPTRTASASATATRTVTAANTVTATPTQGPANTATSSATPSPANTVTVSVSPTGLQSATSTATPPATALPSAVPSTVPTALSTATASPTVVPATASATPTQSVVPATATGSPTATAEVPTPVNTATFTTVATTVPTADPTAVPASTDGPVVIRHCGPGNDPNPRNFFVEMEGSADGSVLSLYDASLRCAFKFEPGGLRPGWNNIPLPAELAELSNGTYFFRLGCQRQGRQAAPAVGRIVILR
jgi:hypothetical protein